MRTVKVKGGLAKADLRIALAELALSENKAPFSFSVMVQEVEDSENFEEHTFLISGFQSHGGDSLALFLPITGEGAPENDTKIIYYPDSGTGWLEIDEDEDAD